MATVKQTVSASPGSCHGPSDGDLLYRFKLAMLSCGKNDNKIRKGLRVKFNTDEEFYLSSEWLRVNSLAANQSVRLSPEGGPAAHLGQKKCPDHGRRESWELRHSVRVRVGT